MRWKYIENIRYPSERAHSYQITKTCEALTTLHEQVTLVVPNRKTAVRSASSAYYQLAENFNVQKIPVFDALNWAPSLLSSAAYALERLTFKLSLRHSLTQSDADILYTRDPHLLSSLKNKDRRVVLELHDISGRKKSILAKHVSCVTHFIVISAGLRDELLALGIASDRILIAPDGYDPKDFVFQTPRAEIRKQWNVPSDAVVTLYAGGLYPWKGLDFVLDQWSKTPDKAYLVIIGGPLEEYARLKRTLDAQPSSRVRIFPPLPHSEVVKLFGGADLGLLPTSPEHIVGRLYTSPLKLFEYLAGGLPIIASDVPTSREILTPTVAKFFQHRSEDFLQQLNLAITDDAWRYNASAQAYELVKPYSWLQRTQNIVQWLQRTTK